MTLINYLQKTQRMKCLNYYGNKSKQMQTKNIFLQVVALLIVQQSKVKRLLLLIKKKDPLKTNKIFSKR